MGKAGQEASGEEEEEENILILGTTFKYVIGVLLQIKARNLVIRLLGMYRMDRKWTSGLIKGLKDTSFKRVRRTLAGT